jgi:hypothetical protein
MEGGAGKSVMKELVSMMVVMLVILIQAMVQADDLSFSYHPPILTSFQQCYSRPILPPYHDAKSPTRSKKKPKINLHR